MELTTKEKRILYLLAAVSFTNILDFMIMMPLGNQFKEVFDLIPSQWSLVISSYTFSAGISGILTFFIIDRFERKSFLLSIYTGFIIGTAFCALAFSYESLVVARAFTGIFGGVINAILFSMVGDILPVLKRGKGMGVLLIGFSAASSLGVPLGLYLGLNVNWQAPFIFIVGVAVLLWFAILKFIPKINNTKQARSLSDSFRALSKIFRNKTQIIALAGLFSMFFGHFIIIPFLAPYMVNNVGISENHLTWIYFIGGIVTIFSSPFIGRLTDKYGRLKVYAILALLSLIPHLIITNMGPTPIHFVLIASTLLFILGGRSIPANTMVLDTATAEERGAFMSIRSGVQQMASALASFIAGYILMETPSGTYENYSIAGGLGAILTLSSIFLMYKAMNANKNVKEKVAEVAS
ncbi:MFS transporter [Sediminitomix flava]|uniref:Putative MFS family arabinose efflux permease n=1 Tax=Sediminitomix flava TaxID=379075 RepID=A0A315ZH42_SEDFL|nr:MFS transporter [Sediminitomix flava]PWJ44493.1 putative MFS family arabinose efflux permease [Sediminitomix flava]